MKQLNITCLVVLIFILCSCSVSETDSVSSTEKIIASTGIVTATPSQSSPNPTMAGITPTPEKGSEISDNTIQKTEPPNPSMEAEAKSPAPTPTKQTTGATPRRTESPQKTSAIRPPATLPPAIKTTPIPRKTEKPPTPTPKPTPTPLPTNKPQKSIYDAPFDIEAIRRELIQVGEREMGWRHRTHYTDGTAVTPDNASWDGGIKACETLQGTRLRQKLHDYVTLYTDELMLSIGGEQIEEFTIYIAPQGNNSYIFYLLH